MASSSPSLLCLLTHLTLFLNFWLVPGGFAWRNHHGKYSSKLSGPIGWPLLGSLPLMGSLAHRKLATMAASCGATRLMALSLGVTPVIISSHPDTAKEILCGSSFSNRPVKASARLLMFERAIGFAPSGDYCAILGASPQTTCSLPREFLGLRLSASVWLMRWGLGSVEGEGLGFMVIEGYELIAKFNWEDYFPLGFIDFYGVKRRCSKLAAKVNGVVGKMIEERKRVGELSGGGNDFLSVLLSLPKEDQLSDSDMVAVLWEMIFRGTDTVAILLEWIMARMVIHQDIQAKAQEELDTCLGNQSHVQDSHIQSLPYLQAIVKEALRMHPPGPLLSWARLAIHDVHVGKFFVPAGTTAMVNMWAIAHDPTIWKDPWAFKPDRFINEDVSIMGSDLRLAPFGSGRRACPGKALGLATVHLWLARLLHQFKWLPTHPVDLGECLRLSLEMKKPLICCAIPRV
ncbi:Cytochrome P450 78A5 [Vitis vinifera]|uniref:Cytochrome P450 78A5 n=1 Tax=Vitis vinifera TaxID=29760 RepID=A0A438CMP9_VITVI|nr:Cytochrome P450 78A5 [Vitis vinifera]